MTSKYADLRTKLILGAVAPADFEGFDADDVAAIKAEAPILFRGGAISAEVVDEEKRVLRKVGSTEHKDRYGDRIRLRGGEREGREGEKIVGVGWILRHFERAGAPFFLNHRSWDLPLGNAQRVWIDPAMEVGGEKGALLFDLQYLQDGSPQADVSWAIQSGKGMPDGKPRPSATSVGFLPSEGKVYRPETEKERKEIDLGYGGVEFLQQELLEISDTWTPANPWAVALSEVGSGEEEREVEEILERLVEGGVVQRSAALAWRRSMPLGPRDAMERVRARVRSFVVVGAGAPAPAVEQPRASERVQSVNCAKTSVNCTKTAFADAAAARAWATQNGYSTANLVERDWCWSFEQFKPKTATWNPRAIVLQVEPEVQAILCDAREAGEGAGAADEPAERELGEMLSEAIEHLDAAVNLVAECAERYGGDDDEEEEPEDEQDPEDDGDKGLDTARAAGVQSGRLGAIAALLLRIDRRVAAIETRLGEGGSAGPQAGPKGEPVAGAGGARKGVDLPSLVAADLRGSLRRNLQGP